MKRQPPLEQPFLVVMPSAQQPESERVIVDPTKIALAFFTTIGSLFLMGRRMQRPAQS